MQPVRSFYATGERRLVSRDRHATILPLGLIGDGDAEIGQVLDVVDAAAGGGFQTTITGEFTADHDFTRLSQEDLEKGELEFGLPVALLVLLLVFGAVVAGLLPVLVALVSIAVALGLTALVGQAFDLSIYVVNMISGMGLALGIDYSLFVVSRFREDGASATRSSTRSGRSGRPPAERSSSAAPRSCSRCSAWCSSPTRSSAASRPAPCSSAS